MRAEWFRSTAPISLTDVFLCAPVRAQDAPSPGRVDLVVEAGRPLRIALAERVKMGRVGQPIAGTLVDPLYAYDRVVVPAGTVVSGHVEALEPETKSPADAVARRG